ncbi:MAG: histidine kinase [Microbacterium sp.]
MSQPGSTSPSAVTRAVVVLLALEAIALLGIAAWEIVALVGTGAGSVASAVALIVMTLISAAGVAAFAWGVRTGRSWGRSGGVVAQLLLIAVAVGAITGEYAHPLIALAIGLPAAVTLVLLVLASRGAPDPR